MMNYKKFFKDVFNPLPSDKFIFIEEVPNPENGYTNAQWAKKHNMMLDWRRGLAELSKEIGFAILPDLKYEAPPDHNAPLVECILTDGGKIPFENAIKNATVFIAFGETSISSTLLKISTKLKTLRGASLPGIVKEMEESALAADYSDIKECCLKVASLLNGAEHAIVEFSTGHVCCFDLRFRNIIKDDGYCGIEKLTECPIINLPSGEVCQSPYEGERPDVKSNTSGIIPMFKNGEIICLHIRENKIVNVDGPERYIRYFLDEPGRCNIAEFAIGVNKKAVVRGNELEDEKAGFHFAYGVSDHLGGVWGPEEFKKKENICHIDVVYAKASPIFIKDAQIIYKDGGKSFVYKNGELLL